MDHTNRNAGENPREPREPQNHTHRKRRELAWFGILILLSFAFVFGFVRPVVAAPVLVDGQSMLPALHDGDRVAVVKPETLVGPPERGDVVVFESPEIEGQSLIKRVVATPGDTVSVNGDAVYVNGEPLPGARANGPPNPAGRPAVTVPPGHVYVLGDNRGASNDSRDFGPVPTDRIQGEALVTFWPPGRV